MLEKIKGWLSTGLKSFNDFLQANPKVKNWLDGLEKAVIAAVLAYLATLVEQFTNGTLTAENNHALLAGIVGGLWIAISGAVKAYSQNLHDIILANTQDVTQAIQPTGNSPVASSALTPVSTQGNSTLKPPTVAPRTPNLPPRN